MYWFILQIDFMLISCFPLRAYRLGLKAGDFYRSKRLYQDVIKYFEHRCSCCDFLYYYTYVCDNKTENKLCKCCLGFSFFLRVFLYFTVGIIYWILLFPLLLLPLGCDCVYESKLRSKYPYEKGDLLCTCKRCCNCDVSVPLPADDNNNNNNNNDYQKQEEKTIIDEQPYVNNYTEQYSQIPVYQFNPYVLEPEQA